jgi:hypothetical protein
MCPEATMLSVITLLGLLLTGAQARECRLNSDCPLGEQCGCPGGVDCFVEDIQCLPCEVPLCGHECLADQHCRGDEVCSDFECMVPECLSDLECALGQVCSRYTCETDTGQDVDRDGVPDREDNCQAVPNADQDDADRDGRGDQCDSDRDGDGVSNTDDVCPHHPDAQLDMDADGVGDVCDPDRDGDGTANTVDNCIHTANASQADADGDGLGDACDLCRYEADAANLDIDLDGLGDACDADKDDDCIPNALDNCPSMPNKSQGDGDGDGIGDACDEDMASSPAYCALELDVDLDLGLPDPLGGACVSPTLTPGCPGSLACELCVGTADPYCIEVGWDVLCISLVEGSCAGSCGGP